MATTTHELPRETWRTYFDELSEHLGTVEATVEVAGLTSAPRSPPSA